MKAPKVAPKHGYKQEYKNVVTHERVRSVRSVVKRYKQVLQVGGNYNVIAMPCCALLLTSGVNIQQNKHHRW